MYLPNLPWWVRDIVALTLLTHMTSVSITLYLHRYVTHDALVLHPFVQWLFRAWLWLNTGMGTKDWVGVHTWHHATVDTADDPHSPRYFGLWGIVAGGVLRYRAAVKNRAKIVYYTNCNPRVPRDKWEQRLFDGPFHHWGVTVLLALNLMAFWHALPREGNTSSLLTSYFLSALPGVVIWLVQIAWTPLFAAGVVNGFGHAVGYRNYDTPDDSRNVPLTPILEFLTTGENFHNNHHKDPENPKFSWKWWEIDWGWGWFQTLKIFGLAWEVKRAPA